MLPTINPADATRLAFGVNSIVSPQTTATTETPKNEYPKRLARLAQLEINARLTRIGSLAIELFSSLVTELALVLFVLWRCVREFICVYVTGWFSMTVQLNWGESVLVATIDRPERRNAVDRLTLLKLATALDESVTRKIRVVIITGTAPAFCSGADLSGVRETEFTDALHKFLLQLATLPSVTIAAIAGPALGAGAQIAMSCDLRVATAQSVIGVPAARLGLVVNHWTVERLARECSWPVARAMLLAARNYSGAELASFGSVHRLGELEDAISWANEIALLAPLSMAGHKAALNASSRAPEIDQLVQSARDRAWASSDVEEGRSAFIEKRQAKFKGE